MTKPIILTLISEKELPEPLVKVNPFLSIFKADPRIEYLKYFSAVNVKFAAYDRGFGKVIDDAGCERHAWEYLEMSTPDEAERLARSIGARCTKHRIKVFNVNSEAGWSGTDPYVYVRGGAKYANPYETMKTFLRTLRLCAPTGMKIWYNGWSWQFTSDGRKLHDATLMEQFDAWSPMVYATSPIKLDENWMGRVYKYVKRIPSQPVIPMVGVGRVADNGAVWGFWIKQRELLTQRAGVGGVSFFFGNGAKPQMLQGHSKHPALISCVRDLRDDDQWGN